MAEINIDLMALDEVCYSVSAVEDAGWTISQVVFGGEDVPLPAIRRHQRHLADHCQTLAHYMCVEQPKPAVVTSVLPKAKPALAGLGIVQDGRVRGVGFCDV